MKKNMGSTDRIIRLMAVAIIVMLYVSGRIEGTLGVVLMVLAAVFALTSFISFCPIYAPFGFYSNKKTGSIK